MSSKARRPYLMGNKSVTQFYQAPVRFLKEIVGRESEFEKPYADEDYRKMHLDFPWPDWPPFPDIPPWPPWSPPDGPVPKLSWCGITCTEPSDCDEPIWCRPWVWCGHDMDCNLCTWVVEGATSGYTRHEMYGGYKGIDVWIDTTLVEEGGEALIRTCMTDPCGNVCCHDSEVGCKICPPEVAISWASGDLTVVRSGSVGVEVADGLGPYSWSVAGTGFSIPASTEGVTNTLSADATACGVATITVTDYCGDTTVGYVRCTEGVWILKETCASCFSDTVWQNWCVTCGVALKETISGYQRWTEAQRYEYYPNTLSSFWGVSGCGSACGSPDPPCGSPIDCGAGTPCTAQYNCQSFQLKYYEWECPP